MTDWYNTSHDERQSCTSFQRGLSQIQKMYKRGDRWGALDIAREIASARPDDPQAGRLLVECALRCDRIDTVISAVDRLLQNEQVGDCSHWFDAIFAKIAASSMRETAIARYTERVETSLPSGCDWVAAFALAVLHAATGDFHLGCARAADGLAALLSPVDSPTTFSSRPLIGVFDLVNQRAEEAKCFAPVITAYERAIALLPNYFGFHINLTRVLSQAGNTQRSLWHSVEAFRLAPQRTSDRDLESLSRNLQKHRLDALYCNFCELVLRERPGQATIAVEYSLFWLERQNVQRSMAALQRAVAVLHEEAQREHKFVTAYIAISNAETIDNLQRQRASWLNALQTESQSSICSRGLLDLYRKYQQAEAEEMRKYWICTESDSEPPLGYHNTTADYFQTAATPDERYTSIDDKLDIQLCDPVTLPGEELQEFKVRSFQSTPLFVAELKDARLCWGGNVVQKSFNVTATIAGDRHLLADLSPRLPFPKVGFCYNHPKHHWLFEHLERPPLQQFFGTVANLASIASSGETVNYYHWLIDLLPRIGLMRDAGIDFTEIDRFLVDNFRLPFQRESLAVLKIPLDRVASIHEFPYLRARRIIAPAIPGKLGTPSHYSVNFLRRTIGRQLGSQKSPFRRLYICRDCARYRRIFNSEELRNLLKRYGFVSVNPETLTFAEQVKIFSEAEAVVAPHGAGLANIVFCQPGTAIFELLAPGYRVPYYWILSSQSNLRYYYLTGTGMCGFHLRKVIYPRLLDEDFFVDCDRLKQLLDLAGLTQTHSNHQFKKRAVIF